MSAYDDLVPWDEGSHELTNMEQQRKEAEEAKIMSAIVMAKAMPVVVRVLLECLEDDDRQVRLRAADLMMSRNLPKIAAKHAEEAPDNIIDSSDVAAIKQSIVDEIKKRKRS